METAAFTEGSGPPALKGSGQSQLAAGRPLGESVKRYRQWVSNHRIVAAALAGFVAVHIATICGFFFPGVGLPKLDFNTLNGMVFTPTASANVQFLSGAIIHYTDGVVFAIMYALTLHLILRRWRSSNIGNVAKGLVFGTILATVSAGFMAPRVYFPHVNVGFFAHNLGWKVVFAIYLWHWIYGLHLGTVYNPLDDRELAEEGDVAS